VERLVDAIPAGRVMTYGDIAAWCGHPGAARAVGLAARLGADGLPWHRVVRSDGSLVQAVAAPDGWQAVTLASEGVSVEGRRVVSFERLRWRPGAD
jgi:methylated-DNA-protein-cysteine methyltransferase-like protein